MKDRLKKKLKAKKLLGNNKQRSSYFPKPAKRRKEYEMPEQYKQNLQMLSELLEDRDEYAKTMKILPPEVRSEALPIFKQYDVQLEKLEQAMADEYENYQGRQNTKVEAEKTKRKAAAHIQEMTERIFIVAKHKFEPADFKDYKARVLGKMSSEVRETFLDNVAIRESYDLENILADPDGSIKKPMKHPQIQLKEAIFEINRIAYETDDFFKEACAELEKAVAIRNEAEKDLWLYQPDERQKRRLEIEKLDRQVDEAKPGLIGYLEACFAEDGKVEIKNPDQKKLDAAFAQAEIASDRVYLMYKHAAPHLLEGFEKASFLKLTPEEIAETRVRIAKREAIELDEILAAVKGEVK